MVVGNDTPPCPEILGPRTWNGREVYWTGRVAIGARYTGEPVETWPDCVRVQGVLLHPRPLQVDQAHVLLSLM